MKDIIALARAAGFKITEHRTGVFIDAPSPCNITVASILALHEAEIRKEFEGMISGTKLEKDCVTVEDWKRKAMYYEHNWKQCSNFANTRIGELTAQNVKLIEAVTDLTDACVTQVGSDYNEVIHAAYKKGIAALTPQPEEKT